jgi:hypothetical protein
MARNRFASGPVVGSGRAARETQARKRCHTIASASASASGGEGVLRSVSIELIRLARDVHRLGKLLLR